MKNKRIVYILSAVVILLMIPLIAMQFTKEVDWSAFDFLLMGIMLTGTGLLCELVLRKFNGLQARLFLCGLILFTFILVWAELAVGIFGTRFAGS